MKFYLNVFQVPMAGIDGTQVMQTINVPKNLLIGASERPVLLTVTPKNGIHKGQKQIVVLTRNQSGTGIGAVAKSAILSSAAAASGTSGSPAKVLLGPRPAEGGVQQPPSPVVTDINRLLAQVQPVSSSELQRQGMMPSPVKNIQQPGQQQPASYPTSVYNNSSLPQQQQQMVVASQAAGFVSSPQISSSSSSGGTPVQFVVPRPMMQQQQLVTVSAAAAAGGVGQQQPRIVQAVMRPAGATTGHLQQLVVQNGKPVLVTSAFPQQEQQQQHQQQLLPQVNERYN
jgi:hypothetical protein